MRQWRGTFLGFSKEKLPLNWLNCFHGPGVQSVRRSWKSIQALHCYQHQLQQHQHLHCTTSHDITLGFFFNCPSNFRHFFGEISQQICLHVISTKFGIHSQFYWTCDINNSWLEGSLLLRKMLPPSSIKSTIVVLDFRQEFLFRPKDNDPEHLQSQAVCPKNQNLFWICCDVDLNKALQHFNFSPARPPARRPGASKLFQY